MQRLKTFIRNSCDTYKRVANGIAGMSFILLIIMGSAGSTYWLLHQSFEDEKAQLRADHTEELKRLTLAYGGTLSNEVLPEVREAVNTANEAAITASGAAVKADKALSRVPNRIPPIRDDKIGEAERSRINQKVQETNRKLGAQN